MRCQAGVRWNGMDAECGQDPTVSCSACDYIYCADHHELCPVDVWTDARSVAFDNIIGLTPRGANTLYLAVDTHIRFLMQANGM